MHGQQNIKTRLANSDFTLSRI